MFICLCDICYSEVMYVLKLPVHMIWWVSGKKREFMAYCWSFLGKLGSSFIIHLRIKIRKAREQSEHEWIFAVPEWFMMNLFQITSQILEEINLLLNLEVLSKKSLSISSFNIKLWLVLYQVLSFISKSQGKAEQCLGQSDSSNLSVSTFRLDPARSYIF